MRARAEAGVLPQSSVAIVVNDVKIERVVGVAVPETSSALLQADATIGRGSAWFKITL